MIGIKLKNEIEEVCYILQYSSSIKYNSSWSFGSAVSVQLNLSSRGEKDPTDVCLN